MMLGGYIDNLVVKNPPEDFVRNHHMRPHNAHFLIRKASWRFKDGERYHYLANVMQKRTIIKHLQFFF